MKRKHVESSVIKSMKYNEENEALEVTLISDEVYLYNSVPLEEYLKFLEQPSLGTYYNKEFKNKFPDYKKIQQLH